MTDTYRRAYRKNIDELIVLDAAADGDPEAQSALADACRVYVRAVTDHHDPCADLLLAYIYVLEHTLDDTEGRLRNAEALIDEQFHDEFEEEDVPTPAPVLEASIAKMKSEVEAALSDLAPDESEAPAPEKDPEPAKPRKRTDQIIEYLTANPGRTRTEIADAIGCAVTTAYYPLDKLTKQGILRTETDGEGRLRYYVKGADE